MLVMKIFNMASRNSLSYYIFLRIKELEHTLFFEKSIQQHQ